MTTTDRYYTSRAFPSRAAALVDAEKDFPEAVRATWPAIGESQLQEPDLSRALGFGSR